MTSISITFEENHVANFDYNLDNENLVINAKLIRTKFRRI